MPYIKLKERFELQGSRGPRTAGELNYVFTQAIISYLQFTGLKYQSVNDVVGALVGAKDEFSRRVVKPYEKKKILENGDVYPEELLSL